MAFVNENNFVNNLVIEESDSGEVETLKLPTAGCITDNYNIRLYIDGTNGNDLNSGADDSHPLKTLDKVTELINNGRTDMRIIFLTGGDYRWAYTSFNAISLHMDNASNTEVNIIFDNSSYRNVVFYNSHVNINGTSYAQGHNIKLSLLNTSGSDTPKIYFEGGSVNFGSNYGGVTVGCKLLELYGIYALIHNSRLECQIAVYGSEVRLRDNYHVIPADASDFGVRVDRNSVVDIGGTIEVNTVSEVNFPFIYNLRSYLYAEFSTLNGTLGVLGNKFSYLVEQHGGLLNIARGLVDDSYASGDKLYSKIATNGINVADGCVYHIGTGVNDATEIKTSSGEYELPKATTTTLGGVIVGSGLTVNNGFLSADLSKTELNFNATLKDPTNDSNIGNMSWSILKVGGVNIFKGYITMSNDGAQVFVYFNTNDVPTYVYRLVELVEISNTFCAASFSSVGNRVTISVKKLTGEYLTVNRNVGIPVIFTYF